MINTVYQEGAQIIRDNMNYTYPPMANLNALLNGVTVGASGAVYAILLGFGMLFPNQPLFIFPLPFPIKAKYFVIGKTEYHTTQVCEVRYIVVRIVGKTGVQFNQCISDNKVFGFR